MFLFIYRVHTRQGKVREKIFFSRSGNCQGILQNVREILKFGKCQGNVREFSDLVRQQFVKVKAVSSNISFSHLKQLKHNFKLYAYIYILQIFQIPYRRN